MTVIIIKDESESYELKEVTFWQLVKLILRGDA